MTKVEAAEEAWSGAAQLEPGQAIDVRGLHADGVAYRWWPAMVEAAFVGEISVKRMSSSWPPRCIPNTEVFQRECRRALSEALRVGERWTPRGHVPTSMDGKRRSAP
jgi:hypothetical protein